MNEAFAVLPVKRFAGAKQRVAGALGDEARRALAQAMLSDVLAALARCRSLKGVIVVSGEAAAKRLAIRFGAEVVDDPSDRGHSEAAVLGCEIASRRGGHAALLVPGDCPLLDPGEVDALVARSEKDFVAVVPDRHGTGTNALLLRPPDAITPAFGPGSRDRHLRLAAEAGMRGIEAPVPSLALDLDTPDDLAALRARAEVDPGRCPATAATLRELATSGQL